MAQIVAAKSEKKWELTRTQMIIVMLIGALLLVPPMLISTEAGTTAHTVKIAVGFLGVCVLFVGAYLRPIKAEQTK